MIRVQDLLMNIQLPSEFDDILQSLCYDATAFFWLPVFSMPEKLALAIPAHLTVLNFEVFKAGLQEHFD